MKHIVNFSDGLFPPTPDIELARMETQLAAIALTHGGHPRVILVATEHLEAALNAIKQGHPNKDYRHEQMQ